MNLLEHVKTNAGSHVVVSLSERNLMDLLIAVRARGGGAKFRVTEGGSLTVIGEPDARHYADRPDALELYGIGEPGVASTPSSASSPLPEPWQEPFARDAIEEQ